MNDRQLQTSNRRLLELAEFLETRVPRERFNMGVWAGADWQGDPQLSCGTPACAIGWASTLPEFRHLGLELVRGGNMVYPRNRHTDSGEEYAIAEVFLIDPKEARDLFLPDSYRLESWAPDPASISPDEVARKIRHFVASRQVAV